jgi:hypothetical protein
LRFFLFSFMISIDFTAYKDQLRIQRRVGERFVWDPVRKKWLLLQPEELVRQLLLAYLIQEKQYKLQRIRMELGLKLNTLEKRCDLLVYDHEVKPWLLAECKAPHIAISQNVFEQIARYNMVLQVPYLLVTNGLETYCCKLDYKSRIFSFLEEIPDLHP